MDLDADKITNNPEEAMRQALLLQQMQKEIQEQQPNATSVGQDPMGTGGGTIGTGQAPVPGEQGAPTGGGPQPQQQQQPQQSLPPEIVQALQQVGG
jgi:hypothetical protein